MNNHTPALTDAAAQESAVLTFEQWKNDFLRIVMRVSSVLFLIAIGFGSNNTLANIILYIVLALILGIAGFVPMPYSIRALIMLLALYIGGTMLLLLWGIQSEATMIYLGVIALAALLYEKGQEFIAFALALVSIFVVGWLTINGTHILTGWSGLNDEVYTIIVATWTDWISYAVDLFTVGLLLIFAIRLLKGRFNQILQEAKTSLHKLAETSSQLEARVADRTTELNETHQQASRRVAQLHAITQLSETIAQIQDLNEVFSVTTHLISERFGFYHVGIFLIDEDHEYAVLQAANSEGGQRMLTRSHRLKLGTGVVGFCAQSGQPRIALDVGADAVYFDNPDLPETRSEAALPLNSRDQTIGVLDVQSLDAAVFTEEDLQVLTTLANQVSIALENTRLLMETRAALAQVQEVYDEFTRAEWSRTVAKAEQPGFRYHVGRIEMLENALDLPEVVSAVQSGQIEPSLASGSTEKRTQVAVPVKIRGEVIGVIHIESNDSAKVWKDDEIRLVEAVAERAALAMENARLFQDARRRAAKEQAISQATTRISGALNIENILHTTAEELERVLGGSEVLIRFQNKERS